MTTAADVVVIGGGIIGSACAYYLAREGLSVVQVEAKRLGAGASGACDGFIILQDKLPGAELDLALLSARLYSELSGELDLDFEYTPKGGLQIAENDLELLLLRERAASQSEGGLAVTILSREEALAIEPALAPDITGGSLCPLEAEVNPMLATLALARGAKSLGVRQLIGSPVTAIRVHNGRVEGVVAGQDEIHTPRAVVAAGAWSPQVGDLAGVDIPVLPRRGQILVTEPVERTVGRLLFESGYMSTKLEATGSEAGGSAEGGINAPSATAALEARERAELGISFVLEQTRPGNFLIGSSRDFAGYDRSTTHRTMAGLAHRAVRFVPALKDVRIIRHFAGLRPYTPDHRPIIGPTERLAGLYLATGHEGDGITLAPATGYLLAQEIAGRTPELPLVDYSLDRPALSGRPDSTEE